MRPHSRGAPGPGGPDTGVLAKGEAGVGGPASGWGAGKQVLGAKNGHAMETEELFFKVA